MFGRAVRTAFCTRERTVVGGTGLRRTISNSTTPRERQTSRPNLLTGSNTGDWAYSSEERIFRRRRLWQWRVSSLRFEQQHPVSLAAGVGGRRHEVVALVAGEGRTADRCEGAAGNVVPAR